LTTENILWIIAITIIALLVAVFQYFFKAKRKSKKTILFAFLRFLSVFTLLLLLVNPKITITNSKQHKPELTVLVDQSASISYLKQEAQVNDVITAITKSKDLADKFEISIYGFGDQLKDSVTNTFEGKVIIVTDGNQTYGQDYSYYKSKFNQPIFSVPLGDTTKVADLFISTVNAISTL